MNNAVSISQDTAAKSFINLIFTDTYFGRFTPNDPRAIENNLVNIRDSLHFNSVHIYGYGNLGGGFNEAIGNYSAYISGLMDQIRNSGLRGFYGRSKIEQLSCGQRLEYEAEGGNNGFSYSSNTGYVNSDSGRQVVKGCINTAQCPETDATPRYLCQNIYENLQHGDLIDFSQWDLYDWHLKPVMRIDSNVVDNNPNAKVIRIDVINYKGLKIDSIILKARNFAKFNAQSGSYLYPGNYINTYNFDLDPGVNLEISGDTASGGLNNGMRQDPWENWKDNCKVDFKVWWFGEVDVWLDKMIVDDHWANQLFSSDTTTKSLMESKITEEVSAFTSHMGAGSFFIDEVTHSQIPCIKRVYELMKLANSNAKLNFAVTNYFNIRSYKDNSIGNRELLSQLNSESFNADAHEIQDVLPNTLNSSLIDPKIDPFWLRPRNVYNEYLQKRYFGDKSKETGIDTIEGHWVEYSPSNWGSLVYQVELARSQRDIYEPKKKFIMQPQIQGVLKIDSTTGYYKGGIREPLNEEIEAQAMLSIAHGADGISWFIYYGQPTNFESGEYYIFGLQNHDPSNNYPLRLLNMYGQQKWKAVRNMNLKIEHWKPTLDKINWKSGWSVHKDGADHNYISDIKSIIVHSGPPTACEEDYINYDCQEDRYWEMGFFDPDFDNPAVNQYDKSKYFIMVNRRCVPDTPNYGQGDLRQLKIKFDSTELAGFTNWKLIDLDTNYIVSTFNKNTTSYINLGEFKPGAGKLYKLAPVMQEGGALVADEECGGDIECKGEVNNNGKNMFLKPGTNINFADHTARIKMEGGVFKSGYSQTQNSPVYLKGKDNSSWKGISLYGCDSVLIKDTHISDVSPYPVDSTYAVDMINCKFINIESGSFVSEGSLNAGCIRSGYVINGDFDYSAYIQGNTFETDEGEIPVLSFIATAGLTLPLIIDGNIFTSSS